MRKILLFVIIGLTFNAMAQKPHKATGDKPLYSKSFEMNGENDSIFNNATVYTYDAEQRIISSINHYPDYTDSASYQYDQKGRTTSINVYLDDELIKSTVWIYDEVASRIDNYMLGEGMGTSLDTTTYIIYYGVKDMESVGESMSIMDMDIKIVDCDSMYSYMNMYDGAGLVEVIRFYPVYQDGHPATAVLKVNSEMVSEMLPGMAFDLSINLVFTYSDQKLMTIKGSTTINMGFPITLNNFLTMTNQYAGDLLTEMKSEIDVAIATESMYMGTKINTLYNSEGNKIGEAMYYSETKGSWDLESKIWYYYEGEFLSTGCTGYFGLSMSQNFPNPAIDKTIVNYSVPQDGEINFNIYSISGQLLYNKKENASFGEYQMELNLSDYASGIYFYTMEYKGQRITKRMSIKR